MGVLAESFTGLGEGDSKYLYFKDDELHIAAFPGQQHKDILKDSGRLKDEIQIAGAYTAKQTRNKLIVDAEGSDTLQIPKTDPTPVIDHIRTFPDSEGKKITPCR